MLRSPPLRRRQDHDQEAFVAFCPNPPLRDGRFPRRGRHPVRARLRLDPGRADHERDLRQPVPADAHASGPLRRQRRRPDGPLQGQDDLRHERLLQHPVHRERRPSGPGRLPSPGHRRLERALSRRDAVPDLRRHRRDLFPVDRLGKLDREPHRDDVQPQRPGPLPRRRHALAERLGRAERLPFRRQGRTHRLHVFRPGPRRTSSTS